jgi:hypothetical protein
MANKESTVKTALIGAAAIIGAALIAAVLQPSWWRSDSSPTSRTSFTIAGTVVDQTTNRGVGQANISIVGRAEKDVTEDNGNFRVELEAPIPKDGIVRIHVVKAGYMPYDGTTAPTGTLIIQLREM